MRVVKVYRVFKAELRVGELHSDYFSNTYEFEESYGLIIKFLMEANLNLEVFIKNLLENPYLSAFSSNIKSVKEDKKKKLLTFTTEDNEEIEVDIMAKAEIEVDGAIEDRKLIFSGGYLYLVKDGEDTATSIYLD